MKGRYQTVYILPLETEKELGNYGWEFNSLRRVPSNILGIIIKSLSLCFHKSYLGIEEYISERVQMSVSYDETGLIEHISFQIYDDSLKEFRDSVRELECLDKIDFFYPKQEKN